MRLHDLIRGMQFGGATNSSAEITDVTEDSRLIRENSLFIARPGLANDGRRHIPQAIAAGAVAVLTDTPPAQTLPPGVALLLHPDPALAGARLAERLFGEPSRALRVVGITGTNGKSTIAHLTRELCTRLGARCGLIGTIETDDGQHRRPAALTTPAAADLSRLLGAMARHRCSAAAIELSSHALHQGRSAALRIDTATFTNLTGDHLDYHRSMEAYADAKALLFASLDTEALAIVNADDPWHARMLAACRAPVLRCSLADARADATARWSAEGDGLCIAARGPWGELIARPRIIGAHNAMNLLQALVAAWRVTDADADALARAADGVRGPTGRLEPIHTDHDAIRVYVDYAHTDDALRHCLVAARQAAGNGRLWVVFGCGGERDATKRPRMGAVAAELADRVVMTSDNPRREQPGAIIDAILAGVPASGGRRADVIEDRAAAIAHAIAHAQPGDTIVIAGKGHEREQIAPDGAGGVLRRPFDDAEHARAALAQRRRTPEARLAGSATP